MNDASRACVRAMCTSAEFKVSWYKFSHLVCAGICKKKPSSMLTRCAQVARSILDVKRQEDGGGGQGGRAIPEHSDLTFSGISLQTTLQL